MLQTECDQEEPGSIILSCPEQKSSDCPHQSKIKGFNNQWDFKKKKKSHEDDVRVHCMCALINWCWLKLGLACVSLADPVDVVGVAPSRGVTFYLAEALQSCSVS